MKQDINKLMEEARVAVKHASDKIADAHAEIVAYDLPGRDVVGHLRELCDALYGLALHARSEVQKSTESLSQVMERTQAKKCFVVPTRERMAQEEVKDWSLAESAPCPMCKRDVKGRRGAYATCQCSIFLRRADNGEWYCVNRSELPLAGPKGTQLPMTAGDRMVEGVLRRMQMQNPDYEMVWDAPPGPPDWEPVVGTLHALSNGNVAYVFDAGPDRRRTERAVERKLLKDLGGKYAKDVKKEHIKRLRKAAAVHKTCPSWGETQCGLSLFSACAPKDAIFEWKGVTCKECLKLRGVRMPRDKGIRKAVRAAKRRFVDNGDVKQKWADPQPNHPNRFYLLVNGVVKKCQTGNGYFTIEQARRLQKKLTRPGVKVKVAETYLHQ